MRGNNLSLGKAGELRVASELLLRGYEVFLTITDTGVDLILGNGKRLQVKTARTNKLGTYVFSLKGWRGKKSSPMAHQLTDVDYIICWATDDNAFFIIPASNVRGRFSICINPNSSNGRGGISRFMAFKNNWEILQ